MRAARLLPALALILASLGCAGPAPRPTDAPAEAKEPESVATLLDAASRDVIRHPDVVKVAQITTKSDPLGAPLPSRTRPGVYRAEPPRTPEDSVVAQLGDLLLSEDLYLFGAHTRCLFNPGVALRFEKGQAVVEALICFTCDEMLYTGVDGRDVMVSFDPRAGDLRSVTRKALKP